MRNSICGVLLGALFFPIPALGNGVCQRPKELAGSTERARKQVALAEAYGARFLYAEAKTELNIRDLAVIGKLVRVDDGPGYFIEGIGESACGGYPRRLRGYLAYARPEVASFLAYLGERFSVRFPDTKFKVTSLARTRAWQRSLRLCGATSVENSPHEWGFALDISKRGRSDKEICFLWNELRELQERNLVIAVDEVHQNNIHVMVRHGFVEWKSMREYLVYYPLTALLEQK